MECCKVTKRSEEEKKKLMNRINRLIGQMEGIKKMVATDRYCDDILVQLAAIDKAIKSLATQILDSHLHSCLIKSINEGDYTVITEITDLFRRFQ